MALEVFKFDPFLLKSESQKEYGRALLKNVLVRRTSISGRTRVVDLFDPTTWSARGKTSKPQRPTAAIADKYLKSRIERKGLLSESEREQLMRVTMLCRSEITERRIRDIKDKHGNVAEPKFATHEEATTELAEKGIRIDQRLRIAAVGVRVKVSKLIDETYLNEDLCLLGQLPAPQMIPGLPDDCGISELGRTTKLRDHENKRWTRWVDTVCGHIRSAVESQCQVIVLPEFSLPPEVEGEQLEAQILQEFQSIAQTNRSSHFIFAGSRHEGGVNRGLVRCVRAGESAHPREWHYKVASARSLGENILGPRSDVYVTYNVQVEADHKPYPLHATVAICYDTFDPSTFLSLVLHTASREALQVPQIILVPSFNPSEEFVQMLRDLSFLTGSMVVYVNSLHGDARAFIAGFSVGDLLDQSCTKLLAQIDEHLDDLGRHREDAKQGIADANRQGESILAREISNRARLCRQQKPILEAFQNQIKNLQQNHALDHLITVERCRDCESDSHSDDYICRSDILYYNIDVRLLMAIQDWRRNYFKLDESFLPEPFRQDQLEAEATALTEREQNRARRSRGA